MSIGTVFALAEAPTVNGQRHQSLLGAIGRVGGLRVVSHEKLLLAEIVHASVPVNKEKSRGGLLNLVGNEQERGHRFEAVQIEDQPLEREPVVFFGFDAPWRRGVVVPRQVAEQSPKLFAPLHLARCECFTRKRGLRLHRA